MTGNVAGKVAGKEMRLILAVRGMLENSLEFFDTSWNGDGE